eukprot:1158998-Pelagomonas_calceolata.AAC.5
MDGESSLLTLHSFPLLVSQQHAIDFLARQSSATDAIPQNMAKLARGHEAVTLLFMDICGFTTMAKAIKDVLIEWAKKRVLRRGILKAKNTESNMILS